MIHTRKSKSIHLQREMSILTEGNNNNKEVSSNHLEAKVPLKAGEEKKDN